MSDPGLFPISDYGLQKIHHSSVCWACPQALSAYASHRLREQQAETGLDKEGTHGSELVSEWSRERGERYKFVPWHRQPHPHNPGPERPERARALVS